MDTPPPAKRPSAIRLENCGDVHIEGNTVIGADLLHATQTKRIKALNNTTISSEAIAPTAKVSKISHVIKWVLGIVGAVIAAGAAKWLGWV